MPHHVALMAVCTWNRLTSILPIMSLLLQFVPAVCVRLVSIRWAIIGQREEGDYDWDKSAYNQCWLLHRAIQTIVKAPVVGDILERLGGSIYVVRTALPVHDSHRFELFPLEKGCILTLAAPSTHAQGRYCISNTLL